MSSESNTHMYTEGPWTLDRKNNNSERVKVTGPGWSDFAKVVVRMSGTGRDSPEGWANANLIAAAPELLEALKLLHGELFGPKPDERRDVIDGMCRRAIAKAEGRTPSKTANPGDVNEQ